ncbi:MAG: cytochrome c biogenesis heme-transporting ATPase CcmA [Burkholderiales bacterium]|jgi:heme exporter protein A|nr:cytochrome c biogenesis heme-transporting ATPase CcmA [Burkholderiales bacterium]
MTLPTLRAEGLTYRRGEHALFAGLNLELPAGCLMWLRGHNGRGKTSLLRLLAGLALPDSGRVTWGGVKLADAPDFATQRTYIAHANALKDDLTAYEALQFLAALHGRDATPAALHNALSRLGMKQRQRAPVRTLSQGQRRRVALARLALERAPGLWVLDEPFDALDVDGIGVINALLEQHLARGGSVILTSHQALSITGATPQVHDLPGAT